MKKIAGIMLMVTGIVVVAINLIFKINEQKSVTVIGGADGPTSIFLAGKIGGASVMTGMITGVVLFAVGVFIIVKRKGTNV